MKTASRKKQNTDNALSLVENCDIKFEIFNKLAHLNQLETQITVMSESFFSEGFSLVHVIITTIIISSIELKGNSQGTNSNMMWTSLRYTPLLCNKFLSVWKEKTQKMRQWNLNNSNVWKLQDLFGNESFHQIFFYQFWHSDCKMA